MPFEITGTVKILNDVQTFANDFKKREFVLTTDHEKYPQDIIFGCLQDKIEIIDSLKPGDKIKVFFDISGREWNEKYFVNLNAWKIEGLGSLEEEPESSNEPASNSVLEDEPPF